MSTRAARWLILLLAGSCVATAARAGEIFDRPNILWLSFEDTSPYAFGCYGNAEVSTPNVDALAKRGVVLTNASSVAPHCSPARSSIISGCFATTYGTDWHRHGWRVPEDRYFFPSLLRQAGYYTTNNSKTDYNCTRESWNAAPRFWDEQGNKATYNSVKRKAGQPFFSVFNSNVSHMGRVRSIHTHDRREFGGYDPYQLTLPPHVPDLPEVRSDFALHLEGAHDVDQWVKLFLNDLKQRGLDDDTIIFVFSDHGGCLPRGKAFPFETGLRAVMVVYVPEKWHERCGLPMGTTSDRLVGFEDLAPTVLRLAGIEAPAYMQGRSFMEPGAPEKEIQFGFRCNTGFHYDPDRTAYDGRFKYIRSYTPYKPYGLRQSYQWGVPGQFAWDVQFHEGKSKAEHQSFFKPKPTEQLFDLKEDPWEMNDLAQDPRYRDELLRLRKAVSDHVRGTKDLGFFPRTTRIKSDKLSLHEWVRETGYPLDELIEAAEIASEGNLDNADQLVAYLASDKPEVRFWGVSGLATLASRGVMEEVPEALLAAADDENEEVSVTAAEALCYLDRRDVGLPVLMKHLKRKSQFAASALEELGELARPIVGELKAMDDRMEVRSLLINFGELPYDAYYPPEEHEAGYKVNRERRNWHVPSPDPTP